MRVHPKNRETNIKINIKRSLKLKFSIILTPFHDVVLHFQVDYELCEVQPIVTSSRFVY